MPEKEGSRRMAHPTARNEIKPVTSWLFPLYHTTARRATLPEAGESWSYEQLAQLAQFSPAERRAILRLRRQEIRRQIALRRRAALDAWLQLTLLALCLLLSTIVWVTIFVFLIRGIVWQVTRASGGLP